MSYRLRRGGLLRDSPPLNEITVETLLSSLVEAKWNRLLTIDPRRSGFFFVTRRLMVIAVYSSPVFNCAAWIRLTHGDPYGHGSHGEA
jgi:hypothetical protein